MGVVAVVSGVPTSAPPGAAERALRPRYSQLMRAPAPAPALALALLAPSDRIRAFTETLTGAVSTAGILGSTEAARYWWGKGLPSA